MCQIIGDTNFNQLQEVFAYLEAHFVKRQWIEIIAKELLGLNDDEDEESRSPYPAPDDDKEQDILVKGKETSVQD